MSNNLLSVNKSSTIMMPVLPSPCQQKNVCFCEAAHLKIQLKFKFILHKKANMAFHMYSRYTFLFLQLPQHLFRSKIARTENVKLCSTGVHSTQCTVHRTMNVLYTGTLRAVPRESAILWIFHYWKVRLLIQIGGRTFKIQKYTLGYVTVSKLFITQSVARITKNNQI